GDIRRFQAGHGSHADRRAELHAGEPCRRSPLWRARPAPEARLMSLVTSRGLRLAAWQFGRSFASSLGLALVATIVLLALIGPWIVPYPDDVAGAVSLAGKLQPPSATHWFGTDEVGNDVLTRTIIGARLSLLVGIGITLAAAIIGVPLGILAGTAGGKVREIIMRLTDLFLSVPGLVLAIALVAALGAGIINAMIALVLVWWPGYVRLAESKALSIREEPFIEAARVAG